MTARAGHVLFIRATGKKRDEGRRACFISPDSRLVVIEVRPCGHYHGVAYFQKLYLPEKRLCKGAARQ